MGKWIPAVSYMVFLICGMLLYSTITHFQKALKRFLKVIDCMQQIQVRENVVGFEKALGAVIVMGAIA